MIRTRVLITLGGGGHLWQARSLARQLQGGYDLRYVTSHASRLPEGADFSTATVFRITDFSTISNAGVTARLMNVLRSFVESRRALDEARPDFVVCVGTALSVPLLLAARMKGVPGVFVESITRVDGLSKTGRIIKTFGLAERIYVQWPDAARPLEGIHYEGTVL